MATVTKFKLTVSNNNSESAFDGTIVTWKNHLSWPNNGEIFTLNAGQADPVTLEFNHEAGQVSVLEVGKSNERGVLVKFRPTDFTGRISLSELMTLVKSPTPNEGQGTKGGMYIIACDPGSGKIRSVGGDSREDSSQSK